MYFKKIVTNSYGSAAPSYKLGFKLDYIGEVPSSAVLIRKDLIMECSMGKNQMYLVCRSGSWYKGVL